MALFKCNYVPVSGRRTGPIIRVTRQMTSKGFCIDPFKFLQFKMNLAISSFVLFSFSAVFLMLVIGGLCLGVGLVWARHWPQLGCMGFMPSQGHIEVQHEQDPFVTVKTSVLSASLESGSLFRSSQALEGSGKTSSFLKALRLAIIFSSQIHFPPEVWLPAFHWLPPYHLHQKKRACTSGLSLFQSKR